MQPWKWNKLIFFKERRWEVIKGSRLYDLSGKVALVTGGSIGLGRQISQGLAEAGAEVAICARRKERCVLLAEELSSSLGVKTLALSCNVAEQEEVEQMMVEVVSKMGKIDILINNAGISWAAPAEKLPAADWQKVMEVNINGVFYCSQAAGKEMIKQQQGRIINIASVAALAGSPSSLMDAIAYNTSKGAVVSFTRDLAVKWAKYGINVNAIAPGWFPTHMSSYIVEKRGERLLKSIPMDRFGGEEDLKGVAVFLSSAAASYITGQVIVVDGGLSASFS